MFGFEKMFNKKTEKAELTDSDKEVLQASLLDKADDFLQKKFSKKEN